MIYAQNLKYLIMKRGIGEMGLSEKTNISQAAINRIKNGAVCPTIYQSLRLADHFMIDVNDFLKLRENKDLKKDKDKYIPVIAALPLLKNGTKLIAGFYLAPKSMDAIAIKTDSAFACAGLTKDAI